MINSELIFLFFMGAFFFVVGIIGICNQKPSLDNLPILLFPIIGAGIMIVTATHIWDIPALSYIKEHTDTVVPILFLALFLLVGIMLIIGSTIDKIRKKAVCTYEIQAQCIDVGKKISHLEHRRPIYSPVWKYTYGDREYTYKSDYASNIVPPELNEYYPILINPANPEQIYVPDYSHNGNLLLAGILFTLFPIIVFVLMFFL